MTLVRGKATDGDSVMLKASRYTDRLQLDFSDLDISPQFRHDTGFVNQVGMRDLEAHQGFVFRDLRPSTSCGSTCAPRSSPTA